MMASVPQTSVPTCKDCRTMEEEIVAVVVVPKGAIPCSAHPSQWTDEVVCCPIYLPLPVIEYVTEVGIAVVPPYAIEVSCRIHVEEVFEIHLINEVVLLWREVEFVGHFVGKEVGLCLCVPQIHAESRDAADDSDDEK